MHTIIAHHRRLGARTVFACDDNSRTTCNCLESYRVNAAGGTWTRPDRQLNELGRTILRKYPRIRASVEFPCRVDVERRICIERNVELIANAEGDNSSVVTVSCLFSAGLSWGSGSRLSPRPLKHKQRHH